MELDDAEHGDDEDRGERDDDEDDDEDGDVLACGRLEPNSTTTTSSSSSLSALDAVEIGDVLACVLRCFSTATFFTAVRSAACCISVWLSKYLFPDFSSLFNLSVDVLPSSATAHQS